MSPIYFTCSIDLVWLFGLNFQICRTSVSLWDFQYLWWGATCLSNSSTMNPDACNVEDIVIHITEFVAVFCCIFWELVLPLAHLIIHPVQEWSRFLRHFWVCFGVRIHLIAFNSDSVRVWCAVTTGRPVSHFHQFIRFPPLGRPS